MSDEFYQELASDVEELLAEFGTELELYRKDDVVDPVEGTSTGAAQNIPTVGLLLGYKDTLIDGAIIKVGDRRALLQPSVAIEDGDKLRAEGKLWTIINLEQVNPTGTRLLYKAQVRA